LGGQRWAAGLVCAWVEKPDLRSFWFLVHGVVRHLTASGDSDALLAVCQPRVVEGGCLDGTALFVACRHHYACTMNSFRIRLVAASHLAKTRLA